MVGLADAGKLQQLRRVDRARTDHHFAPGTGFLGIAADGIAHTDTSLALQHQTLGQGIGDNVKVRAVADRSEVAMGCALTAAPRNGGLAHGDAVLVRTVIVRIVRNTDLASCLDDGRIQLVGRWRIGDAQGAFTATELIIAAVLKGLHALEEGQHVPVAPALVAHLRPSIEILRLATHKGVAVDRAGPSQQLAARHSQTTTVGAGLRLTGIEPVGLGIVHQLGIADGNPGPRVARRASLQQQHLVAGIGRQPVSDGGTGRARTDDNIVICFHRDCALDAEFVRLFSSEKHKSAGL